MAGVCKNDAMVGMVGEYIDIPEGASRRNNGLSEEMI